MKSAFLPLIALALLFARCQNAESPAATTTVKVAFGSCAHQDKPQPLLDVARGLAPDAFIYLGDNIYGDSYELDTLRTKYARLAAKPEFQALREATTVWATWDDHDYGWNDAGKYFPFKAESKTIFMDFWGVPEDSPRRLHEGIYGVEYIERDGHRVQVILLDTRTFRSNLKDCPNGDNSCKNDYIPHFDADSTFLGATQWAWLGEQLRQPADVRIIASSNQFAHAYNGWESWTNVPVERQRMIDLIRDTKAEGVVFISGDVHWGELSKQELPSGYPLYDVTSSGITETWDVIEPNANRIGDAVPQNNVGLITIDFATQTLTLSLVDASGQAQAQHRVSLGDLGW